MPDQPTIIQRAEEYEAGKRCISCKTLFLEGKGRGCRCGRERLHREDSLEVAAWFANLPESERRSKRGKPSIVESAMFSALGRLSRQSGFTDMPEDMSRVIGGATVAQDLRLGVMAELHAETEEMRLVNVKWQPPRSKVTPRAEREPL